MTEQWDCIFIDRIEQDGRIYLTHPQEYGSLSVTGDKARRYSMTRDCGSIKGHSGDNKVLIASSTAAAYNYDMLRKSRGLIVRESTGATSTMFARHKEAEYMMVHPKKAWTAPRTVKGTTGWLVYISPDIDIYYVYNGHIGEQILGEDLEKIMSCINHQLEVKEDYKRTR